MFVGIDLGGTYLKYGLVSQEGEIVDKGLCRTPHQLTDFYATIADIVDNYRKEGVIDGLGISSPGIIQADGRMLAAGSLKGFVGANYRLDLQERLDLPIQVENDGNCVAIAEKWLGNAKNLSHYICVVIGTGMGGGIVINNQLYRGGHGMAGEFGLMMIDQLPSSGNLEAVSLNQRASVIGGYVRRYNEALVARGKEAFCVDDARIILQRADQKNPLAQTYTKRFITDLAVGLINILAAFDPEAILLGGGISANGAFFSDLEKEMVRIIDGHGTLHFLKPLGLPPLLPARLHNDAGLLGAVYLVKQSLC